MRRFYIIGVFVITAMVSPVFFTVSAQVSGIPGLVNNIEINDTQASVGDILSGADNGIFRASKNNDPQMIGVIVELPVISVGDRTTSTVPVLSSGRAVVNVSAANGAIKPGDFVTSSENTGVGQKATSSGYVLGKALGSYDDTSQNGKVAVLVEIGYFSQNPNASGLLGSLMTLLSIGFQNSQNFPLIMRYMAASFIGVATFGFASFSFLRFMRNGIEAIGRNPLAKNTIVSGMVLNGVVVGILAIAGFGVAVAIVVL